MAQKIAKLGIEKESGWLYFLDKNGDVSRCTMKRGTGSKSKRIQRVVRLGMRRQPHFMYFIDSDGDLAVFEVGQARSKAKTQARNRRR